MRYILISVLTFGTSVASLAPQLVDAMTVGMSSISADSSPSACCCGTTTGNCCDAGACDSRNAPTPEPSRAPVRDTAQSPTLGLIYSQVPTSALLLRGTPHDVESETLNRSLADATLQTAHVRLDT